MREPFVNERAVSRFIECAHLGYNLQIKKWSLSIITIIMLPSLMSRHPHHPVLFWCLLVPIHTLAICHTKFLKSEDICLLGCDAKQSGRKLLILQKKPLPPPLPYKNKLHGKKTVRI
jgi:hypothetical protein